MSTTPTRKGRVPESKKRAERRLTREITDKEIRGDLAGRALDLLSEFVRTANSNPVIGLGLGIFIIDSAYQLRILSYTGAAAFYGFTGATVAANVVGSLSGILPFSSGDKGPNAIQPTATSIAYGADGKHDKAGAEIRLQRSPELR